jgi:hypothetical protein
MEHAMVEIEGLYFVIADGSRARFVRFGQDGHVHTIQTVDVTTVRRWDDDLGPGAGARGPPGETPGEFARLLAERICADFAVDLFIQLVLVASQPVLRDLAATLDGPTAACLIGSLERNLLDVADLELLPHLRTWLEPA